MLMAAGVTVVAVDGIRRVGSDCTSEADLTFEWNGALIDVECKRPQAADALILRMLEAREQIERPGRGGRLGVVALDWTPSIRPAGELLEYEAGEDGESAHVLQRPGLTAEPHPADEEPPRPCAEPERNGQREPGVNPRTCEQLES